MSLDDGVEQGKILIELMNTYGIRATFNLNAGIFGQRTSVEYKDG